jgi:lipocalin
MNWKMRGTLFIITTLSWCLTAALQTVQHIDLQKYMGKWHHVYGYYTDFNLQGYGSCLTSEYSMTNQGNILMKNTILDMFNQKKEIRGLAYYSPGCLEPGKLKLHLADIPVDRDYWICELGPVNENNEYDYSVVSDRFKQSLFVLARDRAHFYNAYQPLVFDSLKTMGFRVPYNAGLREEFVFKDRDLKTELPAFSFSYL